MRGRRDDGHDHAHEHPQEAPMAPPMEDDIDIVDGDMEIDDAPMNNVLLGDAIEEIIKINFAERSRLKHP